jgi:hypothetical protein
MYDLSFKPFDIGIDIIPHKFCFLVLNAREICKTFPIANMKWPSVHKKSNSLIQRSGYIGNTPNMRPFDVPCYSEELSQHIHLTES